MVSCRPWQQSNKSDAAAIQLALTSFIHNLIHNFRTSCRIYCYCFHPTPLQNQHELLHAVPLPPRHLTARRRCGPIAALQHDARTDIPESTGCTAVIEAAAALELRAAPVNLLLLLLPSLLLQAHVGQGAVHGWPDGVSHAGMAWPAAPPACVVGRSHAE